VDSPLDSLNKAGTGQKQLISGEVFLERVESEQLPLPTVYVTYKSFLSQIEKEHLRIEQIPFTHRSFGEMPQIARFEGTWPIDVCFCHYMARQEILKLSRSWHAIKKEHSIRQARIFCILLVGLECAFSKQDAPETQTTQDDATVQAIQGRLRSVQEGVSRMVQVEFEPNDTESLDALEKQITLLQQAIDGDSSAGTKSIYGFAQQLQNEADASRTRFVSEMLRWHSVRFRNEQDEFFQQRVYIWSSIIQLQRAMGKRVAKLAIDAVEHGIDDVESLSPTEKRGFFHLCRGILGGEKLINDLASNEQTVADATFYADLCGKYVKEHDLAEDIDVFVKSSGVFRDLGTTRKDDHTTLPAAGRFLRACEDHIHKNTPEDLHEYWPSDTDCAAAKSMFERIEREVSAYSSLFTVLEHYRGPDRYVTQRQQYPTQDPYFSYLQIVQDDVINAVVEPLGKIFNMDEGKTLKEQFTDYASRHPKYSTEIDEFAELVLVKFREEEQRQSDVGD
jgi:hypothetical protein